MLIFRHESPFELNELPAGGKNHLWQGFGFIVFFPLPVFPPCPLLDLHMEVLRGRMTHSGRNFF